jgi:hypothetical protein
MLVYQRVIFLIFSGLLKSFFKLIPHGPWKGAIPQGFSGDSHKMGLDSESEKSTAINQVDFHNPQKS